MEPVTVASVIFDNQSGIFWAMVLLWVLRRWLLPLVLLARCLVKLYTIPSSMLSVVILMPEAYLVVWYVLLIPIEYCKPFVLYVDQL